VDPVRSAREAYGRAEARYEAGDFEAAEHECETALRLDPGCTEADALYSEIQFVLGKRSSSILADVIACPGRLRQDQVLVELRGRFQSGQCLYSRREFDAAEREFRLVLEYLKWLPDDLDVLELRREATIWLECGRLDRP